MRSSHSPEPSLFVEERYLVCFFLVRGPAFTSLKIGVGHRLDAQASGVLGRWGGCSDIGLGEDWEIPEAQPTFNLTSVSHHYSPLILTPNPTSWWKGVGESQLPTFYQVISACDGVQSHSPQQPY